MSASSGSLRRSWTLEVNGRCQATVATLLDLDSERFAAAFERLAATLPEAKSLGERVFLHDRLQAFALTAGRHFHRRFQDPLAGCP